MHFQGVSRTMISLRQVEFCLLQGKIKDGLLTKDGKAMVINLG